MTPETLLDTGPSRPRTAAPASDGVGGLEDGRSECAPASLGVGGLEGRPCEGASATHSAGRFDRGTTAPVTAGARPDPARPAAVVPVPRTWASLQVARLCGGLPLVAGLSITALAMLTDNDRFDSTLASLGMFTLLGGSLLFVVGWLCLGDHWWCLRALSETERERAPSGRPEVALLLANPPAALVCIALGIQAIPIAAC